MAEHPWWSGYTRSEFTVLRASILLVVDGVIPWWYRVRSISGTYNYNAGLHGWGVMAVGAAALALLVVLVRRVVWPVRAPRREGSLYIFLGTVALAALIVQIFRSDAGWVGLYVGVAFALVVLWGGVNRYNEPGA